MRSLIGCSQIEIGDGPSIIREAQASGKICRALRQETQQQKQHLGKPNSAALKATESWRGAYSEAMKLFKHSLSERGSHLSKRALNMSVGVLNKMTERQAICGSKGALRTLEVITSGNDWSPCPATIKASFLTLSTDQSWMNSTRMVNAASRCIVGSKDCTGCQTFVV